MVGWPWSLLQMLRRHLTPTFHHPNCPNPRLLGEASISLMAWRTRTRAMSRKWPRETTGGRRARSSIRAPARETVKRSELGSESAGEAADGTVLETGWCCFLREITRRRHGNAPTERPVPRKPARKNWQTVAHRRQVQRHRPRMVLHHLHIILPRLLLPRRLVAPPLKSDLSSYPAHPLGLPRVSLSHQTSGRRKIQ